MCKSNQQKPTLKETYDRTCDTISNVDMITDYFSLGKTSLEKVFCIVRTILKCDDAAAAYDDNDDDGYGFGDDDADDDDCDDDAGDDDDDGDYGFGDDDADCDDDKKEEEEGRSRRKMRKMRMMVLLPLNIKSKRMVDSFKLRLANKCFKTCLGTCTCSFEN